MNHYKLYELTAHKKLILRQTVCKYGTKSPIVNIYMQDLRVNLAEMPLLTGQTVGKVGKGFSFLYVGSP